MTTILALDTSTTGCSAAVWRDGAVLARRYAEMARGQSEALAPMVKAVMAESGVAFAALDLVAATVGPGAFTGIRVGLATARGIALAAGVPAVGVTTPEAVAAAVPVEERAGGDVLVAVESKRADVFVQLFDAELAPVFEPRAVLPEAVAELLRGPVLLAGDAALRLPDLPQARRSATRGIADAAVVAAVAARRHADGEDRAPAPLYVRPPDVSMPKRR